MAHQVNNLPVMPKTKETPVQSPGGGNGNPLQYPCLKNPMNREAWQAIVQRITKGQT